MDRALWVPAQVRQVAVPLVTRHLTVLFLWSRKHCSVLCFCWRRTVVWWPWHRCVPMMCSLFIHFTSQISVRVPCVRLIVCQSTREFSCQVKSFNSRSDDPCISASLPVAVHLSARLVSFMAQQCLFPWVMQLLHCLDLLFSGISLAVAAGGGIPIRLQTPQVGLWAGHSWFGRKPGQPRNGRHQTQCQEPKTEQGELLNCDINMFDRQSWVNLDRNPHVSILHYGTVHYERVQACFMFQESWYEALWCAELHYQYFCGGNECPGAVSLNIGDACSACKPVKPPCHILLGLHFSRTIVLLVFILSVFCWHSEHHVNFVSRLCCSFRTQKWSATHLTRRCCHPSLLWPCPRRVDATLAWIIRVLALIRRRTWGMPVNLSGSLWYFVVFYKF